MTSSSVTDSATRAAARLTNAKQAPSTIQELGVIETKPRRRRWIPVAVVVGSLTITSALVIAVGEIGIRYHERHRSSVPGTMPMLFYQHLRLRYALVRNKDYYGWARTNAQGMRGPAVSLSRTPGVPRIMIVGASTTFDSFVRGDDMAWPAQLQAELTRLRSGHKVEVVNAGVPGYRLLDNIIRLQTELYKFRPDVIVYYEAHNDIFAALQQAVNVPGQTNTPDEMPVVTPWHRWLERHSMLYTKVLARLLAAEFGRTNRGGSSRPASRESLLQATVDSGAASFDRDLTSFVLIAQSLGARVVVPEIVHVTGPRVEEERDAGVRGSWSMSAPFAPPEIVLHAYARYDDVARAVAEKRGATYVPTVDFGLVGPRWYSPGDPIHFNDAGAARMGAAMARALVAAGVVNTGVVPGSRGARLR
jgi:lysophospholipase L1-like esterase